MFLRQSALAETRLHPLLLTAELRAAATAAIAKQTAKELVAANLRAAAQREAKESIVAQAKKIAGKSEGELDTIRGSIMRPFFKDGLNPAKTEASINSMRSYQKAARDIIEFYRTRIAVSDSAGVKKYQGMIANQEGRIAKIAEWLAKNGLPE